MAAKPLPPVEYLRECFDYDPDTGILTWRERPVEHFTSAGLCRRTNLRWANKEAGRTNQSRREVRVYGASFFVHRIIWKIIYGADPAEQIDHIDGNSLNNKISNMRSATSAQNAHNMKAKPTRDGALKGATFCKDTKRWKSAITLGGKHIHLGRFDTQKEAHEAYIEASKKHHGEFGCWHR